MTDQISRENILCPVCGRFNAPGQRQCSVCGSALTATSPPGAAAERVLCPACQHPNRPIARFCAMCGTSLLKPPSPVPVLPPVAVAPPPGAAVQPPYTPPPPAPPSQPQPQVNCPRCLLPNPAGTRVCAHCGCASLPVSQSPAPAAFEASGRTCPACGAPNSEIALNCRNCGYSFAYRQEVDQRPVNILEIIGVVLIVIVVSVLIGIAAYYMYTGFE